MRTALQRVTSGGDSAVLLVHRGGHAGAGRPAAAEDARIEPANAVFEYIEVFHNRGVSTRASEGGGAARPSARRRGSNEQVNPGSEAPDEGWINRGPTT